MNGPAAAIVLIVVGRRIATGPPVCVDKAALVQATGVQIGFPGAAGRDHRFLAGRVSSPLRHVPDLSSDAGRGEGQLTG